MNKVIHPAEHPDWEVICNRNPEPKPRDFNGIGFVLAFVIEITIAAGGWILLHGWRLL